MPAEPDVRTASTADELARAGRFVSVACALVTCAVGGLVVTSWLVADATVLARYSSSVAIKSNTALALLATGLSLLLLQLERQPAVLTVAGRALAIAVAALGLATFSRHLFDWNLGLDEWLFAEPEGLAATASPNRMGRPASLTFPLLGLALLTLDVRTKAGHSPAQTLAILAILIAVIPVLGYVFDVQQLYGVARFTGIALPTALTFIAAAAGILFARPTAGVAGRILADTSGGMLLRRLIPAAILLPIVLGHLRVTGERAGLYDARFGLTIEVLVSILLFAAITWWTGTVVHRFATARTRAENAERELHAQLATTLENERIARALAERSNRVKDEFLATLSHELRTPLAAVFGWVQLLLRGAVPESEQRRALEAIERNARLQLQLIEDLLDMSRIEAGTIRLDLRDLDLVGIIDAAIATTSPLVAANGLTRVRVGTAPRVRATGDPARLQQVLANLINNAVKFTPAGGRIVVSLELTNDGPEIAVRDTGVGIKPEFLAHVFDRFRQADPSTTRTFGGLGLGLSIARQLTELHGGTLVAESPGEGQGSTFRLRLPPADGLAGTTSDPGRQAADSSQPSALPSLDGTRVLVVDDQEDACTLFGHLLEERGAQVTTARSVDEAVGRLDADEFDVLVSDIAMPVRDGFDLIRHVRQHMNGLPAIALTAFAGAEDRERTLAAGFQAHLTKPVAPEQLIRAVAGLRGR